MSNGVAISLRNVSLAVPKRFSTSKVNLLSGITVDVRPGEFISILGPWRRKIDITSFDEWRLSSHRW